MHQPEDASVHRRKRMAALWDESAEPLDESEQTKVIEDIQHEAAAQSEKTRRLFAMAFTAIAMIFLVCSVYSHYYPWSMEHQRHFKELVPHWVFLFHYLASSFCFLIAATVVLDRKVTTIVKVSQYLAVGIALAVCFMWCKIFFTHNVSNPLLFWIPVVDLAGLALALYVHLDSKSIISMAEGLTNYKYSYKSA